MEQENQNGGSYPMTCLCGCETQFRGRRNQKFLNTTHKAYFNNEKRAMRNAPLAEIFAQMANNMRILIKYYPKSKGQPILYSPLLKEGFNPNAPCEMGKANDTGIEYRVLANYYFRQTENNQQITIYKINHGNSTK
jgi:hypothetical protein